MTDLFANTRRRPVIEKRKFIKYTHKPHTHACIQSQPTPLYADITYRGTLSFILSPHTIAVPRTVLTKAYNWMKLPQTSSFITYTKVEGKFPTWWKAREYFPWEVTRLPSLPSPREVMPLLIPESVPVVSCAEVSTSPTTNESHNLGVLPLSFSSNTWAQRKFVCYLVKQCYGHSAHAELAIYNILTTLSVLLYQPGVFFWSSPRHLLLFLLLFIIIYSVANKSDNADDCRIGFIMACFK